MTPENQQLQDTCYTKQAQSTSGQSKPSKKKQKKWAKAHSSTLGFLTTSKKNEKEVSQLTFDSCNSKPKNTTMTVIDAPGHRDFVKNMITGASQADAAVLFASAKKGEFEAGIGAGGQTREHAFLAFTLGIRQIIVAVNKMDDISVNWSKDRYDEIKNEVSRMLRMVGFKIEKINFVPVSGWTGENLITKGDKMPWYTGPALMEAFDLLEIPAKPTNKPLRVPIQDIYSITGIGTVPVGRVETGTLKPGQTLVFMPSNKTAEVKSIEMHHTQIPFAEPGDNIGMNVRGIAKTDVHRGDVAGPVDNPPTVAKEFIGQIIVIYHPTAIAAGYTPVLHYHTGQIAVKFTELIKKIDPRTGQVSEEHPSYLKTGDAAWVRMEPLHPIAIETFKTSQNSADSQSETWAPQSQQAQ